MPHKHSLPEAEHSRGCSALRLSPFSLLQGTGSTKKKKGAAAGQMRKEDEEDKRDPNSRTVPLSNPTSNGKSSECSTVSFQVSAFLTVAPRPKLLIQL